MTIAITLTEDNAKRIKNLCHKNGITAQVAINLILTRDSKPKPKGK